MGFGVGSTAEIGNAFRVSSGIAIRWGEVGFGEITRNPNFLPKLSSLLSSKSQTTHTHNNRGVEFLPSWNENHDLGFLDPSSAASALLLTPQQQLRVQQQHRDGKIAGGRKSKLVVWADYGSSR